MRPSDLERFLEYSFRMKRPSCTLGGPGIGKTQIHFQVAKKMGYEMLPPLFLASLDPVDIGGMNLPTQPDANGIRRLERLLDDWLEPAFTATEPTVLLLDEFSQGTPSIQCAAAPIFDQRRCGKHKLPDSVVVAATGNRRTQRAGANNTLTHVVSRTARVGLEVDPLAWVDRAVVDGVAPEIVSFIRTYPSSLDVSLRPGFKEDETYEKIYQSGVSYENPRSWYEVSHYVKNGLPSDLEKEVYLGIIGDGTVQLLLTHLNLVRQEVDIASVMAGSPWKFPARDKIGARFAFAIGVGSCAHRDTSERVLEIAKDLYGMKEAEYAEVVVQTAVRAWSDIVNTQAWLIDLRKHPLGQSIIKARRI